MVERFNGGRPEQRLIYGRVEVFVMSPTQHRVRALQLRTLGWDDPESLFLADHHEWLAGHIAAKLAAGTAIVDPRGYPDALFPSPSANGGQPLRAPSGDPNALRPDLTEEQKAEALRIGRINFKSTGATRKKI
jgi:hypothetical protein